MEREALLGQCLLYGVAIAHASLRQIQRLPEQPFYGDLLLCRQRRRGRGHKIDVFRSFQGLDPVREILLPVQEIEEIHVVLPEPLKHVFH